MDLADSEFGFDARAGCLSKRAVVDDEAPLYDPSARGAELSESAFIEHERARSARIVRRSTRLEHRQALFDFVPTGRRAPLGGGDDQRGFEFFPQLRVRRIGSRGF